MILEPSADNVALCASVLREGGVVGMPTETVYGLAASIARDDGIRRVFEIKGRPSDNPLIVHVASIDDACMLARPEVHEQLRLVASLFWPGPLTCVVPADANISPLVTAGLDTVAVRMPQHEVALELIRSVGCPLAAPSANTSGRPSPTLARHVLDDLGPDLPVLDGGPSVIGLESTVVRIERERCVLLRPGSISREQLERALELPVVAASALDDLRTSPGTRYRHYAPTCPVVLCHNKDVLRAQVSKYGENIMVLTGEDPQVSNEHVVHAVLSEATLYAELRRADDLHLKAILVLCDEAVQEREALMNRLNHAAASHTGVL
jgi:L-threonylcarbamoyladenylate synthase